MASWFTVTFSEGKLAEYYSVQKVVISAFLQCQYKVKHVTFATQKYKINIYRNIFLPLVLYGCETWSLTLREQLG